MMPPHRRHIDRIAGGEIGDEFMPLGIGIKRVARMIGMVWIDHARRLPRDRALDGADVEVRYLLGRKESEAPTPRAADRDEIGRASCRAGVCESVEDTSVGGSIKKK